MVGRPRPLTAATNSTTSPPSLFVGNKLSSGQLCTADGIRVDSGTSSLLSSVFCSKGDNITPPQQALGWILGHYDTDDEIVGSGQTIMYCLHETSAIWDLRGRKVAAKEHAEFTNTWT